jgi:hypothetical protein
MLTGEYMESKASSVVVEEVKYSTFVLLMEYLYTDDVQISVETAMELFQVADRFTIDRLKSLCEQEMLNAIDIETAAHYNTFDLGSIIGSESNPVPKGSTPRRKNRPTSLEDFKQKRK